MAYIGNNPDAIQNTIEITRFNGTGACTQFTIPQDVDDAKAIEVLVNSVQQDPDNSYTVTNGLITFSEAPSVGTNNVTVLRRTGLTYTRTQIDSADILPNAVTTVAIANNSITSDKIAPGTVIASDIADGSITSSKLSSTLSISGNFLADNVTANTNFITAAGSVGAPAITTTGDTNTGIFFPAADTIAFAEGGAEAMRIDSSGRLLIGTTSGTRKLTVYENAAQVDLSIVSSTTGVSVIQMGDTAADNQGQIIYRNNGDSMEFGVNGAERMRITSGGVLELSQGQIKFPATQSASTNANTLDDYEEGTWTPIAARYTGGNITAVYGVSNAGKYTKIGRIVILECYLDITSVSSQGSSLSQVTGLPFTPSGSYAATGATFFNTAATTLNIVSCATNQGDNCIYFHESGNSGTLADFAWKAGAMTFTVIYTT